MRFVALSVAFVVFALPPGVEAQAGKVYRLGHLSSLSESGGQRFFEAFRQGLRDLGYVEGRNIVIESRWADGDYERLPMLAKELVSLHPDLIVSAGGPPTARSAKEATTTIPVVFRVWHPGEVENAFAAMAREQAHGLLVAADPMFVGRLSQPARSWS